MTFFLDVCLHARYDPEGIPAPDPKDRVVFRSDEGGEPVSVHFSHQIVRAWFGERDYDWVVDRGFDVTPIALGHQQAVAYGQELLLYADPNVWGGEACDTPGAGTLLLEVQSPVYRAVASTGRPLVLPRTTRIVRAWYGDVEHEWDPAHGETVTTRALSLQRAAADKGMPVTLLGSPAQWVKAGGKPPPNPVLLVEVARPRSALELLQNLTHPEEDALFESDATRDYDEHLRNLSLQRSVLCVWTSLVGCSALFFVHTHVGRPAQSRARCLSLSMCSDAFFHNMINRCLFLLFLVLLRYLLPLLRLIIIIVIIIIVIILAIILAASC